ncbi:MAG: hypothetical protein RR063_10095 [Anaerovoracaceae bacterium]
MKKSSIKEDIKYLYELYGFNLIDEYPDILVYQYDGSYFRNLEIVTFSAKISDLKKTKDEYLGMGYSVSTTDYATTKEAEDKLFNGFFAVKQSNRNSQKDYNTYIEKQGNRVGEYSYINGEHMVNDVPSDKDVVSEICDVMHSDGAQLVILEAAAGFGKTCTSYEVLQRLTQEDHCKIVPLLTELSRNRKASLFRYVLLSEINSKFTRLSYELVYREIQNGKVPLIIDGFDELLSKGYPNQSVGFSDVSEDAHTMLDTISEMLQKDSRAKILLTSRKSSIFAGDDFDEWVDSKLQNCTVTRIQLESPSPKDWIGGEKIAALERKGISLHSLSNPILLSILKRENVEDIVSKYSTIDEIINVYFNTLLEREMTRQSLSMQVSEQRDTMQQLAAYFAELNISADEADFLKEIFKDILNSKLDTYIERYQYGAVFDSEHIPSEDEFLMKLVHHAFLDRITSHSNQIGYINDFIFGILIGESFLVGKLDASKVDEKYLDLCITAYGSMCSETKHRLWGALSKGAPKLSADLRLRADLYLLGKMTTNYQNAYFSSYTIGNGFRFPLEFAFKSCIFESCIFRDCSIPATAFVDCQFFNCSFFNEWENFGDVNGKNNLFVSSLGIPEIQEQRSSTCQNDVNKYVALVLEKFYPTGHSFARLRCRERVFYRDAAAEDASNIENAINWLIQEDILNKKAQCYELNFSQMGRVNEILGR